MTDADSTTAAKLVATKAAEGATGVFQPLLARHRSGQDCEAPKHVMQSKVVARAS